MTLDYDAHGADAVVNNNPRTPVVDGDTIYFGSWDGQLYAIG